MISSPANPRKILFIISTLGAGGAERVMTLLAGEFARRGQDVTLLTLGAVSSDHYRLDPGIRRIGLDALAPSTGAFDALKRNVHRLRILRRAIRSSSPNVIISFMDATNVLTLLAAGNLGIPIVVSERIDPRHYHIAKGWQFLRRRLYPKAHAVVTQTEGVSNWARGFVRSEKIYTIPNPIAAPGDSAQPASSATQIPDKPYILAVGRLDRQKGFDILLQCYTLLKRPRPALLILGEGPERSELERDISRLGIDDEVSLPGRVPDPSPWFAAAEAFILSSRFEGFPNVLLEAMAAGLPVIATDCPSGPSDIIVKNQNGLMVKPEDPHALAQAVQTILDDRALASRLGAAALAVKQTYSLEAITDQWEEMLQNAI